MAHGGDGGIVGDGFWGDGRLVEGWSRGVEDDGKDNVFGKRNIKAQKPL